MAQIWAAGGGGAAPPPHPASTVFPGKLGFSPANWGFSRRRPWNQGFPLHFLYCWGTLLIGNACWQVMVSGLDPRKSCREKPQFGKGMPRDRSLTVKSAAQTSQILHRRRKFCFWGIKSAAQASQMLLLASNLLHMCCKCCFRHQIRCTGVANGASGIKSTVQALKMPLLGHHIC